MAMYKKNEAQDWAWENLKGQWSTLMTPFTQDDGGPSTGCHRSQIGGARAAVSR